MKKQLMTLACLAILNSVAVADVVYVTARLQPSGAGANSDGTYSEPVVTGSDTSAKGTGAGTPTRGGSRFF